MAKTVVKRLRIANEVSDNLILKNGQIDLNAANTFSIDTQLLNKEDERDKGEDHVSDPTTISANNNGPNTRLNIDSGISTGTILNQESLTSSADEKTFQIKCEICGKSFQLSKSFARHMEMEHANSTKKLSPVAENDKSTNTCHACDVDFGTRSSLRSHVFYIHTNGDSVSCQCGQKFANYDMLHAHFMAEHKNIAINWATFTTKYESSLIDQCVRMFNCLTCAYVTESLDDLHLHIQKMHTNLTCKFCQNVFGFYSELFNHFRQAHQKHLNYTIKRKVTKSIQERQTTFKCICEVEFSDIFDLKEHMQDKHELSDIPYTFDGNFNFRNTRKRRGDSSKTEGLNENKKPMIECYECNRTFQSIKGLNIHKSNAHKIKTSIRCRICLKTFKNDEFLDKHVLKEHSRPEKLNENNNNSNSKNKKKKMIEQEPDGVRCPQCERIFPNLSVLKNHKLNTHTNLGHGEFICTFCPKSFATPDQQTNHERRMHEVQMEKSRRANEAQLIDAIEKCKMKANDIQKVNTTLILKKKKSPKGGASPQKMKEDKYQCLVCSKSFDQDDAFHKHTRHDHDTFTCRSCNYKTGNYVSLKKHDVAAHSSSTTVATNNGQPKTPKEMNLCPKCSKPFADMKNLLVHIGRFHPQMEPRKTRSFGKIK